DSTVGVGTTVTATFTLGHIDLMPLGDMASTVAGLIQCNPTVDFVYTITADDESFTVDTRELRAVLDGVSFAEPSVAVWVKEYLEENTESILKRSNAL
ncbi:MAG: ATP-binding protein, partial [Ruthenibacterium sp.]